MLVGRWLFGTSAWAVDKCTDPNGKVSYQEIPCASSTAAQVIDLPAIAAVVGRQRARAPAEARQDKPQSEVERIDKQIVTSKKERRKRDLELAYLPNARLAVSNHHATCEREQAQLRLKKTRPSNNGAGATWEQSSAAEMSVATAQCDTRSRELLNNLDALRQECVALNCRLD